MLAIEVVGVDRLGLSAQLDAAQRDIAIARPHPRIATLARTLRRRIVDNPVAGGSAA
jgi:hypothetical protein